MGETNSNPSAALNVPVCCGKGTGRGTGTGETRAIHAIQEETNGQEDGENNTAFDATDCTEIVVGVGEGNTEKNSCNVVASTHSALTDEIALLQSHKPSKSGKCASLTSISQLMICTPSTVVVLLILVLGIVSTEVAVDREKSERHARIEEQLEQLVREAGASAQRQVRFFTESHTVFAKTVEGHLLDQPDGSSEYFTCGIRPGFSRGARHLLADIHGHVSAGTVWIPKVPKGNRSEYEQSMSHALGQTNFTIMADQDTFHEDLSQHDLVESPEKSTYYPISGKQLDGVSQHRQALFASLPHGLDMGSLLGGQLKETFHRAMKNQSEVSTVPLPYGNATFMMTCVPLYKCENIADCPTNTFMGIVCIILDGQTLVSSVFDVMRGSFSEPAKFATFTEDATFNDVFEDIPASDLGGSSFRASVLFHKRRYGNGRFVNAYIDDPNEKYKSILEKDTLLSPGNEKPSRVSYRISNGDLARQIEREYEVQDFHHNDSFLVNIAGRLFNVKHVPLPETLASIRDSVNNPTGRVRAIGYTATLACVILASAGLFCYQLRRERLLQRERENVLTLKAAHEAHSMTISFAQHELRNPLHVIGAYSQELKETIEGKLSETASGEVTSLCKSMQDPVSQLIDHCLVTHRLINDMMDLAKLKAGKLDTNDDVIDVESFVSQLARNYKSVPRVRLYSVVSPSLRGTRFMSDPLRLKQILSNGLTNASKYCTEGSIALYAGMVSGESLKDAIYAAKDSISMEWTWSEESISFGNTLDNAVGEQGKWLVFRVVDTGKGLMGKTAHELFECFTQGASKPPGLPKERHPRHSATKAVRPRKPNETGKPRNERLRAVSDATSDQSADAVGFCRGNSTASTPSGEEELPPREILGTGLGLPLAKSLAHLLEGSLDLREAIIPSTDGLSGKQITIFEFILPLKPAQPSGDLPDAQVTNRKPREILQEKTKDADEKTPTENQSCSHRWFNLEDARQSWLNTKASKQFPHVVVVDDEQVNRKLVTKMMKSLGYQSVTSLSSGDAVVEYLQQIGQIDEESCTSRKAGDNSVDIIFMDIHMPGKSGEAVCQELRSYYGLHIPLVAMTGNTSMQECARYINIGFWGLLGKPFLKANISKLMSQLETEEES